MCVTHNGCVGGVWQACLCVCFVSVCLCSPAADKTATAAMTPPPHTHTLLPPFRHLHPSHPLHPLQALQALGIKAAFDQAAADFSRASSSPLFTSDVLQSVSVRQLYVWAVDVCEWGRQQQEQRKEHRRAFGKVT